jgi:hypothetical protein
MITPVPTGPPVGVTVIVGATVVTVKVALATSVAVVPVTVTVYVPGAALLGTVNEPATFPLFKGRLHEGAGGPETIEVPGLLVIPQLLSANRNPVPATTTEVPAGPDVGVSVILGPGRVSVKAAVAISPLVPLTVTI